MGGGDHAAPAEPVGQRYGRHEAEPPIDMLSAHDHVLTLRISLTP